MTHVALEMNSVQVIYKHGKAGEMVSLKLFTKYLEKSLSSRIKLSSLKKFVEYLTSFGNGGSYSIQRQKTRFPSGHRGTLVKRDKVHGLRENQKLAAEMLNQVFIGMHKCSDLGIYFERHLTAQCTDVLKEQRKRFL